MKFEEFPPASRDVVLRPLREAIEKRRAELGTLSMLADRAADVRADIAVLEAAIARLEWTG